MSKINNGGPAFPTTMPLEDWGDPNQGMTLRDWFAGQAINGLCSLADDRSIPMDKTPEEKEEQFNEWAKADAKWSYCIADAMLAARERKEDA